MERKSKDAIFPTWMFLHPITRQQGHTDPTKLEEDQRVFCPNQMEHVELRAQSYFDSFDIPSDLLSVLMTPLIFTDIPFDLIFAIMILERMDASERDVTPNDDSSELGSGANTFTKGSLSAGAKGLSSKGGPAATLICPERLVDIVITSDKNYFRKSNNRSSGCCVPTRYEFEIHESVPNLMLEYLLIFGF
ncbi:hypothetical protein Tco_0652477 [Tanacetum coccineum]|uniref:Uncharacterized protein n=1 Tax=Tanacetum coccineum TaxID=301880 RepID=A0ABQ4WXY8_9ASTR